MTSFGSNGTDSFGSTLGFNNFSSGQVFLKLNWSPQGKPVEFYYCCDTKETVWERPQEPDKVSDLRSLEAQVNSFMTKVRALGDMNAAANSMPRSASMRPRSLSPPTPAEVPTAAVGWPLQGQVTARRSP